MSSHQGTQLSRRPLQDSQVSMGSRQSQTLTELDFVEASSDSQALMKKMKRANLNDQERERERQQRKLEDKRVREMRSRGPPGGSQVSRSSYDGSDTSTLKPVKPRRSHRPPSSSGNSASQQLSVAGSSREARQPRGSGSGGTMVLAKRPKQSFEGYRSETGQRSDTSQSCVTPSYASRQQAMSAVSGPGLTRGENVFANQGRSGKWYNVVMRQPPDAPVYTAFPTRGDIPEGYIIGDDGNDSDAKSAITSLSKASTIRPGHSSSHC